EEVGQGGGRGAGVIDLGVGDGAVAHGPTQIDQQVAAEVGFVLETLDVIAVAAGEELPVKVARVVAGGVLAILAELDGETMVRAAMKSRKEPLHNDLGAELQ